MILNQDQIYERDLQHVSQERSQVAASVYKFIMANPHQNIADIYYVRKNQSYLKYTIGMEKGITDFFNIHKYPYYKQKKKQIIFAFIEGSKGLQYLHKNGIIHGDVSLANFILYENEKGLKAKLIDFEFSERRTLKLRSQCWREQSHHLENVVKYWKNAKKQTKRQEQVYKSIIFTSQSNSDNVDSNLSYISYITESSKINNEIEEKDQKEYQKTQRQMKVFENNTNLGKSEYAQFGILFLILFLALETECTPGEINIKKLIEFVIKFAGLNKQDQKEEQFKKLGRNRNQFDKFIKNSELRFIKEWQDQYKKMKYKIFQKQVAIEILKAISNLFIFNPYLRMNLKQFRCNFKRAIQNHNKMKDLQHPIIKQCMYHEDLRVMTELMICIAKLEVNQMNLSKQQLQQMYNERKSNNQLIEQEKLVAQQIDSKKHDLHNDPIYQCWKKRIWLLERQIEYFIIKYNIVEEFKLLMKGILKQKIINIESQQLKQQANQYQRQKIKIQYPQLIYQKFIKDYEKAIKINPKNDSAFTNLGVILKKLGKCQEAIKNYEKATKINPKDDSIFYNLGGTLVNLGKYQEAIKNYEIAIKLNPEDDSSFTNLGAALTNLGKYQEAIKNYEMAIKFNPKNHSAFYNLGNVNEKLGNFINALLYFQQSLNLIPNDSLYQAQVKKINLMLQNRSYDQIS